MSDFVIENGVLEKYNGNEKEVVVPKGVTEIAPRVFWNCKHIESIILPKGLLEIGMLAFYGTSITTIRLPSTLKKIGEMALERCIYLEKIEVERENQCLEAIDGVLFSKKKKALLVYPEGKKDGTYKVPEGTISIERYAFSTCKATAIALPRSCEKFYYSSHLHSGIKEIQVEECFDKSASWYFQAFEKSIVIICALENPHKYKRVIDHLLMNKRETIDDLVKINRLDLIIALLDLEEKRDLRLINDLIEYVKKHNNTELTALLLDYKEKHFTKEEEEALEIEKMEKSLGLRELTVADHRRLFKFLKGAYRNKITILGLRRNESVVEIPMKIGNVPVTDIASESFCDNTHLTSITIPKEIKGIGKWAFRNCPMLTIYAEAETQPSGWHKDWNPDNLPVVWGCK